MPEVQTIDPVFDTNSDVESADENIVNVSPGNCGDKHTLRRGRRFATELAVGHDDAVQSGSRRIDPRLILMTEGRSVDVVRKSIQNDSAPE